MNEADTAQPVFTKKSLISHYAAVRQRMSIRPLKPVAVEIKAPPPLLENSKPEPAPEPPIIWPSYSESDARRRIKVADVVMLASRYYKMPSHEILSDRRTKEIIEVRHSVYWLCKECTLMSYPRIGHWLGGRDHTTILHGVRVIQKRINEGHKIADDCFFLRDLLLGNRDAYYWGA